MRKVFFFALVCAFVACSDSKDSTGSMSPASGTSRTADTNSAALPYTASYSSKFEIGNHNQSRVILDLWKHWEKGDLAPGKAYFADSVMIITSDGTILNGPRDSVLAGAQGARDAMGTVVTRLDAWIPVRATDKNEDWVTVWGMETVTDKAGKVDSVNIHEIWMFNKDGKIAYMQQWAGLNKPKK